MKTAIVLGASGLVGSELLNLLLKSDSAYDNVIVFLRKSLPLKNKKLTQYIIDFENIDFYQDLIRCDDLFCCLGTTIRKAGSQDNFRKVDMDYPIRFAKLAQQNGTNQFLMISSIGANATSPAFYLRTKGQCENSIQCIGFESVSVFRPSALVGKRSEFRLGEKVGVFFAQIFSVFLVGRFRKFKPIKAMQVAKAMNLAAQQNNKGFRIYESDEIQRF